MFSARGFFPAPTGRAMIFSALKGTRAGGAGGGRSAAEIITKKRKNTVISKKSENNILYIRNFTSQNKGMMIRWLRMSLVFTYTGR
jgi:hypothetical protein